MILTIGLIYEKIILLFILLLSITITVNGADRFRSIGYIGQSYGVESPAIFLAGAELGISYS